MGKLNLFLCLTFLFVFTDIAQAQSAGEFPGTHIATEVNHEEGYLQVAFGIGTPPPWATTGAMKFAWALDRGRSRALANLAEQIGKIYLTSEHRIEDLKNKGEKFGKELRTATETMVLWAEDLRWEPVLNSPGSYRVRLGIPIFGSSSSGLGTAAEVLHGPALILEEKREAENPERYKTPDLQQVKEDVNFINEIYTGIVIDATQQGGARHVQFPRIISTDDKVVYSAIHSKSAKTIGAVGYGIGNPRLGRWMPKKRLDERVGPNPLIIKAEAIEKRADMVVSIDDAAKIAYLDQKFNLLKQCRVAFIFVKYPGLE